MNNDLLKIDSKKQEEIRERIKPLLDGIPDARDRALTDEFWHKAARHIGLLYAMDAALEQGSVDEESMSELLARETDVILGEGKKFEEAAGDPAIPGTVKRLFRECVIPIGLKSNIVKHAFTKPRGYAGDYGLIEIIYDGGTHSRGFGYCVDRRFQADDYARAVRSRMLRMKEILARHINGARGDSYDVLNVACGSCREIREIIEERVLTRTDGVSFTLVDQDQEALDFARKSLAGSPRHISFDFMSHSIYDYVRDPARFSDILRDKDLVYTIGLADYIPDDPFKKLVSFLYGLLRPGGSLVIAHKDSKNFSPLAADWWCDWTFHLRDEGETIGLVKDSGISDYQLSVERETGTNIIFFMTIKKKK